jgi:hypothetical protein
LVTIAETADRPARRDDVDAAAALLPVLSRRHGARKKEPPALAGRRLSAA